MKTFHTLKQVNNIRGHMWETNSWVPWTHMYEWLLIWATDLKELLPCFLWSSFALRFLSLPGKLIYSCKSVLKSIPLWGSVNCDSITVDNKHKGPCMLSRGTPLIISVSSLKFLPTATYMRRLGRNLSTQLRVWLGNLRTMNFDTEIVCLRTNYKSFGEVKEHLPYHYQPISHYHFVPGAVGFQFLDLSGNQSIWERTGHLHPGCLFITLQGTDARLTGLKDSTRLWLKGFVLAS